MIFLDYFFLLKSVGQVIWINDNTIVLDFVQVNLLFFIKNLVVCQWPIMLILFQKAPWVLLLDFLSFDRYFHCKWKGSSQYCWSDRSETLHKFGKTNRSVWVSFESENQFSCKILFFDPKKKNLGIILTQFGMDFVKQIPVNQTVVFILLSTLFQSNNMYIILLVLFKSSVKPVHFQAACFWMFI